MKKRPKAPARKRSSNPAKKAGAARGLRTVFTAKQIQKRVESLADQINHDYRGKTLHVVGILENCFLFMADLVRELKIPVACHFMKAEVNDTSTGGVAVREIMYTPPVNAAGKDILLVDGILQSGVTLDHLCRYMLGQNASSVRTATLIEKTDERKVDVATDYVGFKTTAGFLVGYGLGYQETFRNLPYVASMV
jgi:hypoxanthine phosphoribosyltransferase